MLAICIERLTRPMYKGPQECGGPRAYIKKVSAERNKNALAA